MGYIRHHAIAVTTWDTDLIEKARGIAVEIFGERTSEVIPSKINGYKTFFIAPDGSKEGWGESNDGDRQRKRFIDWLWGQAYDDGSNIFSFCEFFYGDDNGDSLIVNHN